MEFAVRTNQISRIKLLEARQFLEVEVVGLTAERASEESIALIGHELDRMRAACGQSARHGRRGLRFSSGDHSSLPQ